ncbi:MAG: class I SAM-dependent methyltransferase, partial [Nitrospira sp.]|nr:class I SAM-dependent methyltransferase [Nitrospira sp.]
MNTVETRSRNPVGIWLRKRRRLRSNSRIGTARSPISAAGPVGPSASWRPAEGDDRRFIGVEPADNMRALAAELARGQANIRLFNGSFEQIPLESKSIDYLYSILAFHWTTNLTRSAEEVARVLKDDGDMDLFFIGRNNGHEFIRKTTLCFSNTWDRRRCCGRPGMRQQLTKDEAQQLFGKGLCGTKVTVEGPTPLRYPGGRWTWWVRIE